MTNNSLVIGADIGGTHITAAIVDMDKKSIIPGSLTREKVDSQASAEQIIESWSQAINNARKDLNIKKIGLAMPGPFDYVNGISLIKDQHKYDNLYCLNIKELLSEKLACNTDDILLINDAAAFLAGEAFGGAAIGLEQAIGITLGTGLGTCIYQNQLSTTPELWSHPFREGIAEDYLSTRWFIRRYKELSGHQTTGVSEIALRIETDDHVKSIFNEFGNTLGDFLIEFSEMAPSEAIIIGGNIAKSFSHFKDPLTKKLTKEISGNNNKNSPARRRSGTTRCSKPI